MSQSLRAGIAIVTVGVLTVLASTSKAELRQFSCQLDNNFVAFELREASEMAASGARTYIVDFQENGPTIRLPPTGYAPEWKDVEYISFEYLDRIGKYGRLSLRIRTPLGPRSQSVGIVQRACWEASKAFLTSRQITVIISETVPP